MANSLIHALRHPSWEKICSVKKQCCQTTYRGIRYAEHYRIHLTDKEIIVLSYQPERHAN